MPPRKKAAASTDATKPASTRATRSSTKTVVPVKPASAAAAVAVPAAKPVSKPKSAAKGKGKGKRARSDSDDEDDGPSKKAKAAGDDDENADAAADDKVDDKPKKMVTIVKRGAAPVDPESRFVHTHQVYADAEGIWDAMLNQTEVGANKNKFYVIQLLHPIGNNTSCMLYTRWGRVGENGQSQTKGPWYAPVAVSEFKKQFKSKTGVYWEQRQGMTAGKGKYTWLERSFDDEDKPEVEGSQKEDAVIPDSKLHPELQTFCNLIFSSKLIDAHLSSMNYDANKLPLGKLAKSTVLNGFAALKKLAEVIETPDGDMAKSLGGVRQACEQLSGEYYSIIPHAFGRVRPTVINDMTLLKKELDLVDALGDMEIASKLITTQVHTDEEGNPLNPLDVHFNSLGLSRMEPVATASREFQTLTRYVADTHGATHSHIQPTILHAFRVEREMETKAWTQAGYNKLAPGDRMLLWHGSRTTNFAGILKQGLRIAPPEAPVTGYMFGKGVYFADMMSKSANYCYAHLSDNIGVLLLCEVAAKPYFEQTDANYDADRQCKANKKLATKGIGQTQPTNWQDAGMVLENSELEGCYMPKGPVGRVSTPGAYLQYNEYIVYDPSQIRLRYLLMVKMF
ncbi:PARP-domain-containing protein [Leucogyrophana mollusca]|uniref:PARP-domain-containing protein n=1 Tax=Leucogyrophana mollusca TaxID=85980 RepID=A0ACB8C1B1_9AGAM|nr:PARP-domain-containing protein [Leucogyrophana mollusca]